MCMMYGKAKDIHFLCLFYHFYPSKSHGCEVDFYIFVTIVWQMETSSIKIQNAIILSWCGFDL